LTATSPLNASGGMRRSTHKSPANQSHRWVDDATKVAKWKTCFEGIMSQQTSFYTFQTIKIKLW
jgi:phage-related tail fiber protein